MGEGWEQQNEGFDEWNGEEWWMGRTIRNNGMIGGDRRREHWLSVAEIN